MAIYLGILRISRDSEVRRFAAAHFETEREHLRLIEEILQPPHFSILLPFWRVAGFLTGALPAFFGRCAIFATIDAVESFIDQHYAAQIDLLSHVNIHGDLRTLLERCRAEELHHRDEARAALDTSPGPLLRVWCWMVGAGSSLAIGVARLV